MKRVYVDKDCPDCLGQGVTVIVTDAWGGEPHALDHADCTRCAGVGRVVEPAVCAYCSDTKVITTEAAPYLNSLGEVSIEDLDLPCPYCMPARKVERPGRRQAS